MGASRYQEGMRGLGHRLGKREIESILRDALLGHNEKGQCAAHEEHLWTQEEPAWLASASTVIRSPEPDTRHQISCLTRVQESHPPLNPAKDDGKI